MLVIGDGFGSDERADGRVGQVQDISQDADGVLADRRPSPRRCARRVVQLGQNGRHLCVPRGRSHGSVNALEGVELGGGHDRGP